ncbi:immunoglobulin superfamily member 10 [Sardina pilchardus]|uniref:immunoglobulin superfamily member 10 n=1 Tax=Sardina pilchardus TaxID=27697 RepID=UPI002E0DC2C4
MQSLPSGPCYLRWKLLALLFVLAALTSKGRACPRSCACYVPTEVHCTFRYLTAIPREIQPVVERINLGYNSLTVLRENEFAGLEHLDLLMLHSNTISNIEDRAFNDLKSLQVLKMSYNKVKEINKDTFSGLHGLVRLHIDHNQIEFINPEAFYGLTKLQLVHLEGNQLQQLHPDTFVTLRHSQVFKMSSVKSVYLSDNALTSIPADLFAGCYQLENVYLHGNPWSCDCRMDWLSEWAEKNPGVLKCKRDKKPSQRPACPVCASPAPARGKGLTQLARDDFTCAKSWIHPYLKQRNLTLGEDDYTPVSAKDFIAPIGTLQMNVTDEVHNDATLTCVVQRPSGVENLNLTQTGDEEDVTVLRATISTSLVCNIDYDQIQQLWRVLATYSDMPMRLERGLLLSMSPEMTYKYRQAQLPDEDIYTEVEADIKANPAWLLQGQINLQLDRTTTTFSTLHIRYSSSVQLRVDSRNLRRDRYSWTMIKRDNQTKTEHAVVAGSTAVLNCETFGNPKPSMEWILTDGTKIRAPYHSDDRRITISDSGKLTLRSVDNSDAGIYRCIATNYLDADVLIFRITVLSPDVEEAEVNGVQLTRSLGQSLLLDCGSTGNPVASIQWILPDHSVLDKSSGNRHVYNNGSLGIQSLTERDRGFFRCLSSNYLGVDLLTSQVSITDEGTKQVQIIDSEGSGLDEIDSDAEETETTHSGLIHSKSSQRTNQESRTITSDRPYPRYKAPHTRGGHRRGSPLSSRRKWGGRRVFDKGSRRVDPQKFAEFMKKAQSGQTTNNEIGKTDEERGSTKTDLGLSGDGDVGSGEGFSEDQIIAMPNGEVTITEMPETNQYGAVITKESENSQGSVMTTTDTYVNLYDNQDGHMTTTESEISRIRFPDLSVTTSTYEIQRDETTPFKNKLTYSRGFSDNRQYTYQTRPNDSFKRPVTLKLTVTDSTDEMQVMFSGDTPESSTEGMSVVNGQNPHVTPMMDGVAQRLKPVVHTSSDPDSQTTFTAVTTTEREQDEITFHTTQRIKSHRLPAGSTIISRQQIQIIPPNRRRPGRRRNFPNRRRIIRPNKITDIQSYLDKFKKPSVSQKGAATVPYSVEITTDCGDCGDQTVPRPVSKSHSGGVSRPLYTHFWEEEISVVSSPSGTKDSDDVDWRVPLYFTTSRPREYTTSRPTTASRTTPSSRQYGTPRSRVQTGRDNRVYVNGRVPPRRYGHSPTHRPPVRPVRPTMPVITQGSKRRPEAERTLTSVVTTTELPTEPEYTHRPSLYDYDDIDNTYDHQAKEYDTTTSVTTKPSTEPSTEDVPTKPRIVGGNAASFTVLSNSDAILPCEVEGNPPPSVSWRRFSPSAGNTLTIRGKMGKFEVFQNGTLYIQDANVKDRGQYLCLAENDYGSDKLIVTLSVVAYPSRILEPKVRDIKVHSGNTVEMNCKTEGRPTPLVSWILANRTQVRGQDAAAHGRVSVTPEGTLVLRQVSVYDRGHYKCIASNAAGLDTATVRLQVIAAPPDILEEKRQQLKVRSGDNLWLPCTAKGTPQPTVHWVLPDASVVHPQRYGNQRSSAFANGTLLLTGVTTADSGVLECIANSPAGSERRVVTLTVETAQTPPQIVEVSQRRTDLEFGDQLRLNCSATGDPKPKIMWRLPSKAVVDQWHRMGSRLQVLDNGTLIIDSVNDKDAGDYICVARSDLGDDLQLLKVGVSMKPAKIETKAYGKKQVPYGKDLQVDCKASGAPMPEISWGLPDGTVVNGALQADGTRRGRTRRFVLFDNGTLYLNKVGMAEEGDYTCYAENTVGKDEMHVHITVITAAPRIRTPSTTYARVTPGGNVRFDCEAVGEPKPKILWMLPSNDMIAASNERYLMHVNGSLDIRDVKLVDAGEYVCMARNTAGDDSKVYKLDIDGNPPVINGYYQNRTVIKETAAKYSRKFIDCKAVGNPPPKITWIMPDNIFLKAPYYGSRINVHHNGTLEIRNVRPTDSAEFICMARNDGGEAVMVVQLEVTTMLRRPIFKNPFNERVVTHMGKTTVLNCSADGHPPPEITWTLPNGTRLSSAESERGAQHHLSGDGTFIIYNPSKTDAGKYRCSAKNSVGYIEKLLVLEVGQKPYILTRPRGVIRAVAGDPLYLHCLADGLPRPSIFWSLPGGLALTRPQATGRYHLMENGTLLIRDAVLHDRGNYHCRARNSAGDAVLTVPVVIVAFPPRITTGPPATVRAVTGVPLKLNCLATGLPTPEITWELPDRSVLSTAAKGRPSGSEMLHPQGTLVIQKPTNADSGAYKCFAKNHLGTDTRITYVRVI